MGKLIGELKKRGFMTYSHENMIIVAPPLIITTEQIEEELKKLDEVLYIADEMIIRGDGYVRRTLRKYKKRKFI